MNHVQKTKPEVFKNIIKTLTVKNKINDNFNEVYDTLGGPSASSLSDIFFQNSTITNRTTNPQPCQQQQ